MSIRHLDSLLPNGLHDAELVSLQVDYETGEVTLYVNADVSSPEDPPGSPDPCYRRAIVTFRDVQFMLIDPPHHPNSQSIKGLPWIDAGDGQPEHHAIELPPLAAGVFLSWIYMESSNSFVRIAAKSVSAEWTDETANAQTANQH